MLANCPLSHHCGPKTVEKRKGKNKKIPAAPATAITISPLSVLKVPALLKFYRRVKK